MVGPKPLERKSLRAFVTSAAKVEGNHGKSLAPDVNSSTVSANVDTVVKGFGFTVGADVSALPFVPLLAQMGSDGLAFLTLSISRPAATAYDTMAQKQKETVMNYLNYLFSGGIAMVLAIITVELSFLRFQRQKRWERMADAYDRLVDGLSQLTMARAAQISALERGEDLPEFGKEQSARQESAQIELVRAPFLRTYFVSKEASARMEKYRQMIVVANDPKKTLEQFLRETYMATWDCLEDIIKIADRDLKSGVRLSWRITRRGEGCSVADQS